MSAHTKTLTELNLQGVKKVTTHQLLTHFAELCTMLNKFLLMFFQMLVAGAKCN